MKTFKLTTLSLLAILGLAACNRASKLTTISGEVSDGVETVYLISGELDSMIVAENGSFTVEIPTLKSELSSLECGSDQVQFIADGTALTVDFEKGRVTSSKKNSVQSRYNAVIDKIMDFNTEYRKGAQEIYADSTLTDEDKQAKLEEYFNTGISGIKDFLCESIKKDKDDYVGIFSFLQVSMLAEDDDEIRNCLALLSDQSREDADVAAVVAALSKREGTAEGCLFKDFAVKAVEGFDKDGSPMVKSVCLSDYVGQGKWMLVDFWASWCGPCKAEIPNLIDVYENFAGENFDVLSIDVWDKPEAAFEAAEAEGICWNQIVCTEEDRSTPTDVYGIEGIPQIILFAPDGTIAARNLRGEQIAQKVAEALGL